MLVKQYGAGKADEVALRSYSEAASLDRFSINAGDTQATLIGTRLDEVAGGRSERHPLRSGRALSRGQ